MPEETADFFASTVKPTVDEFLCDTKDIRRGRLAAIVLYHMADYWDLDHQPTKKSLTLVHLKLIKKCPDFTIIRDVADASKHARLRSSKEIPRVLSSSERVTRPKGLFNAPFGEGAFFEASDVIFKLDDGTSRPLEETVRSVLSMWETMLQ